MTVNSTIRRRIVVGVDGSPQAEAALRWAAHVAELEDASLEVVSAWEYPAAYGWLAVPMEYSPQDDIKKLAETSIKAALGDQPPADLTISVVERQPAQALLEAGKGAYMIVVGSRGRGGFSGLLLGSVSQKVAELASCPVLVIHGHADTDPT